MSVRANLSRFIKWAKTAPKTLAFWLKFAAYAIPLAFLLYVLYWNFLPFGYDKTFVIQVGSPGDTSGEFYLEPSKSLSDRMTAPDGSTYRELNGIAYAAFKPKAVLKNAQITVSVEGDGVSIIPPRIDFDPESVQWDYNWDFSTTTPSDLKGGAFHFDDCEYFDGKSKLEMASSSDMFENGPFTVYAEWKPEDDQNDFQEIVGHFNWELLQNKNSVSFQIGRVNNENGKTYSTKYPIETTFFHAKHSALAIYVPSSVPGVSGYLDLFVDHNFAGRTYLGEDKVWPAYGKYNFSLGKSSHGTAKYLNGCIYTMKVISNSMTFNQPSFNFTAQDEGEAKIGLVSNLGASLQKLRLNAIKK